MKLPHIKLPKWLYVSVAGLAVCLLLAWGVRALARTERTATASITIQAPPNRVWAVLSAYDRYVAWDAPMLFDTPPQTVGQKIYYHFIDEQGQALTPNAPLLTDYAEGRSLRWANRVWFQGLFDSEHSIQLVPLPDGGTLLTQSEHYRGLLVPLAGRVITQSERHFARFNTALKERVEARDIAE